MGEMMIHNSAQAPAPAGGKAPGKGQPDGKSGFMSMMEEILASGGKGKGPWGFPLPNKEKDGLLAHRAGAELLMALMAGGSALWEGMPQAGLDASALEGIGQAGQGAIQGFSGLDPGGQGNRAAKGAASPAALLEGMLANPALLKAMGLNLEGAANAKPVPGQAGQPAANLPVSQMGLAKALGQEGQPKEEKGQMETLGKKGLFQALDGNLGQGKEKAAKKAAQALNQWGIQNQYAKAAVRQEGMPESSAPTGTQGKGPAGHGATIPVKDLDQLPGKLMEHVADKAALGHRELEIQLEPRSLGKITVKISYDSQRTIVAIACSELKTLALLSQNAKEMGAIMENNLRQPAAIYVEPQAADYLGGDHGGNGRDGYQEGRQQPEGKKKKDKESVDFAQKLRLQLYSGL